MAIRKTYGAGSAITSTGVTNNVWNHALAVFADTDGFMTCNTGYWGTFGTLIKCTDQD